MRNTPCRIRIFLETRDRSLHIEGGVAVADYAKRGTTITAQVEAATEGTVSFPLFDYDGYRATLNGQEIAVETGDNNRVQIRVSRRNGRRSADMVRREALVEDHGCGLAGGAAGGAAARKFGSGHEQESLRPTGRSMLLALLCAAAFATGVLTRYPVLEAQVQAMDFPNGTAVSLENGDVYGVVPSGGPGHSLSAGTYRLKWFVDGDGDNALHLYSENGVKMEPETVILPAGQFEGEFEFTLDSAISGLQLQFEFAAGTYMEIYDVRIYTPGCSDNAFTLLFASLAFSLIWVAVRRGRLRTAQIEGMLMIGLAVLFASAPAFQETLHIGDDIQYHLCRIENIVDAWRCGQFPARLGAYMYDGYGALTSVFYPDYALYPFALMRLCGASLAYVGNMLLISLNIGAAAGMYAAAKRMFGGGRAAAAASTLYVLAAYRLTDVYARFAVGEALAMVFLPLFIAALWDCVAGDKNRWKALALSAAAIFLSHMITTLLCALMALLLCLINARRILREKRLANLLKAAGLCLLLVLFHLAPMLMYIREGLGASDLMRDELFEHTARRTFEFKRAFCGSNRPAADARRGAGS